MAFFNSASAAGYRFWASRNMARPKCNCAVPRSADLIIDKTASVQTTAPGGSFHYGLKVTNLAVDSVAEPEAARTTEAASCDRNLKRRRPE